MRRQHGSLSVGSDPVSEMFQPIPGNSAFFLPSWLGSLKCPGSPLSFLEPGETELTAIVSTSESKTFFHVRVLSHFILQILCGWRWVRISNGGDQTQSDPEEPTNQCRRGFLMLCPGTMYLFNHDLILDQSVETQILLGIESLNNTSLLFKFLSS